MSIRDFYKDIKSKKDKNNELTSLYMKPKPEIGVDMPVTQVFKPDIFYQSDLLFMPEDKGYKYILVVVDAYDGKLDAEAVKTKDNKTILKAFKDIFSRHILKYPLLITMDSGTEFKGVVYDYFIKEKVHVKYALTGRHRQVSIVERANQKIATILFKRMASQELLTGEQNKDWVDDLPMLVEVLNEHKKKPLEKEISPYPLASKYSGNLLTIGDRVRYQLDYPINTVNHGRLSGKFRSSDIRWSPSIHRITEVLLKPGFPPMYLIDKDDVARTKQQLNPVKGNETAPDPKYIRGTPQHYIISGIIEKRTKNRKEEYKVTWKGFPISDASWISGDQLDRTEDLKQLKKKFNSSQR
jgi:hypothetical protein